MSRSEFNQESMMNGHMGYGYGYGHGHGSDSDLSRVQPLPQVPLLTDVQMVDDIPPEQHALVPAYMVNGHDGGNRIHPLPFPDSGLPVQPRPMNPYQDLTAYGYGSVAWKERMEHWKQKQEKQR